MGSIVDSNDSRPPPLFSVPPPVDPSPNLYASPIGLRPVTMPNGMNRLPYPNRTQMIPPMMPPAIEPIRGRMYRNFNQGRKPHVNGKWQPTANEQSSSKPSSKKKRKTIAETAPSQRPFDLKLAEAALAAEAEHSLPTRQLVLRFPDPPITREIIQAFHPAISKIHFQHPCSPRYCFIQFDEDVDTEKVIEQLNETTFGDGKLKVEYKQDTNGKYYDRRNDRPEQIDPYILFIGNIGHSTPAEVIKNLFKPGRVDIGLSQKMKNSRYAYIRFKNAQDAIDVFMRTQGYVINDHSLNVTFRRLNGSVHYTADKIENESMSGTTVSTSETKNDATTPNSTESLKSDIMLSQTIKPDPIKSDTLMSDSMSDTMMSDASFSNYTHTSTSRPESPTSSSNHGSDDLRMTETDTQPEIDEDNKEELHKLIGLKPNGKSNKNEVIPLIPSKKLKCEVNYDDCSEDLPEIPDSIDIRLKQEIIMDAESMMSAELSEGEVYRDPYAITLEMQEAQEIMDRGLARELQELAHKMRRLEEEQIEKDFALKKIRLTSISNTQTGPSTSSQSSNDPATVHVPTIEEMGSQSQIRELVSRPPPPIPTQQSSPPPISTQVPPPLFTPPPSISAQLPPLSTPPPPLPRPQIKTEPIDNPETELTSAMDSSDQTLTPLDPHVEVKKEVEVMVSIPTDRLQSGFNQIRNSKSRVNKALTNFLK